jgi:hypothetical protein
MTTSNTRRPPISWRNNNPGNIRYNPANNWQGQIGPGEGGFVKFTTRVYGWRALASLIRTYKERYQLDTIRKIITRFAPPSENNTEAYIAALERKFGTGPIRVQNYQTMKELCKAIAAIEGGNWEWPEDELDQGLRLAGFDLPPVPVHQTGTVQAATQVGAAGLAAQMVQPLADTISDAVPALTILRDMAPWLSITIVVLVAGWFVWNRIQEHRAAAP